MLLADPRPGSNTGLSRYTRDVPHLLLGLGRRLPAWAIHLGLAVVALALALGGARMLAAHFWMTGTLLFGLAILTAMIGALVGRSSQDRRS